MDLPKAPELCGGAAPSRLPGKRNGPAREVLRWVDRGAESLLETLARTSSRQAGIKVVTQVYVDRVGYVDLPADMVAQVLEVLARRR
ncbi:hypothetical protein [Arthrobacter sp. B6]|uniref:hypothetical protein n=1 Tax=Arthrobacter sp. B6 TaxID=1570137 RepID=UPI00082A8FCB|nr:hypothetical protein [Arthrobacter sp. B6]